MKRRIVVEVQGIRRNWLGYGAAGVVAVTLLAGCSSGAESDTGDDDAQEAPAWLTEALLAAEDFDFTQEVPQPVGFDPFHPMPEPSAYCPERHLPEGLGVNWRERWQDAALWEFDEVGLRVHEWLMEVTSVDPDPDGPDEVFDDQIRQAWRGCAPLSQAIAEYVPITKRIGLSSIEIIDDEAGVGDESMLLLDRNFQGIPQGEVLYVRKGDTILGLHIIGPADPDVRDSIVQAAVDKLP